MGNVNKAKGTAFETATIKYLRGRGFKNVYRPATKGKYDTGDINGISNGGTRQAIIQNKNAKTFKLAEWLKGAQEQASQEEVTEALPAVPAVLFKRPGVGFTRMGEQYVLMTFEEFVTLLSEAGYT